MPVTINQLLYQYVEGVREIYGEHLKAVILYGSYARGDFKPESDIDIMILVDFTDMELKAYRHQLSGLTYDFNEKHNLDIKGQCPVLNIKNIVLNPALNRGIPPIAVDLRPACQTGSYLVFDHVAGNLFLKLFYKLRPLRSRPHHTHITL